jgi:hypothetical protein
MSKLKELNDLNGAASITKKYIEKCLTQFEGDLYGVEMGVAYGGGIEKVGNIWKDRGQVWGFDTFEGHPKQIAAECEYTKKDAERYNGDLNRTHAARCMDPWYADTNNYGVDNIKYNFIRSELDQQNLHNVHLVRGLITETTNIDFLPPKIHYALIDLDFPLSQWTGWNLLKNRIIQGGYLCLHDMIPQGHIPGCYEYYQQMIKEGLYDVLEENKGALLVVMQKR